jgi:hypothetical protein
MVTCARREQENKSREEQIVFSVVEGWSGLVSEEQSCRNLSHLGLWWDCAEAESAVSGRVHTATLRMNLWGARRPQRKCACHRTISSPGSDTTETYVSKGN